MKVKVTAQPDNDHRPDDEAGQSLVLIAVTLFFLILIVGLATDAGFLFAQVSQFGASVDSAATAGVVDLSSDDGVAASRDRARQFLIANGWPATSTVLTGTSRIGQFGIPEFSITVTTRMETFFMRALGFNSIPVTRTATAAYYAQTDLLVATAYDRGIANIGNQFIFGPDNCTQAGDPVSPFYATDGTPNIDYTRTDGIYTYRVFIPDGYTQITDTLNGGFLDTVYISLFDPDSYNGEMGNSHSFEHVDGNSFSSNCVSSGNGDQCVIETGDFNSLWYVRVDETYDSSVPEGTCPAATPGTQSGDTVTVYELYVLDPDTNQRTDLASYSSDNNAGWQTDLTWVTPGVDAGIPVDGDGSFAVDLSQVPADVVGNRYIYIDVYATDGTTKNVWDLWAAPPAQWASLITYTNVNSRNLQLWRTTPTFSETHGLEVFAVGRLPLNTYLNVTQTIPLINLDSSTAGGTIYATVFDSDNGASGLVEFTIDTLAQSDFFWEMPVVCDPTCDNQWVLPQPTQGIPDFEDDGIAFFGGVLLADYNTGRDEHTWYANVTSGRPFLTR